VNFLLRAEVVEAGDGLTLCAEPKAACALLIGGLPAIRDEIRHAASFVQILYAGLDLYGRKSRG
jgi:hypothetical protein